MKSAWALGAAFIAVVLVLIVFAVMATEMGSAERLSSTEALDGIDVPVIGTVGDFPDPAHRVVVNVTADGTIVVAGQTLTFAELGDELRVRAQRSRGAAIPGADGKVLTAESVVLRTDGDVAWGATTAVLGACGEACFDRIFFCVRHEGDGAEGALACFFPIDWAYEGPGDGSIDQRQVVVSSKAGPGTPEALCAFLAALPESRTSKLVVALDADRSLSTRSALSMLDAVLRAGTQSVELAFGRVSFDTVSVRAGTSLRSYAVTITDETWIDATNSARHRHKGLDVLAPASPAPPMPAVGRVRGALRGVTAPRSLVYCD